MVGVELLLVVPRLPDGLFLGVGEPERFLKSHEPPGAFPLRRDGIGITRTSCRSNLVGADKVGWVCCRGQVQVGGELGLELAAHERLERGGSTG